MTTQKAERFRRAERVVERMAAGDADLGRVDPDAGYRRRGEQPILVTLANVTPVPVNWLWPGRIPFGKLTLIEGHPGTGKSHLAIEIAACVTTGRALPDSGVVEPSNVIIMTAEDDIEDTVRPRLDAAGGDVRRVKLLTGIGDPADPEHIRPVTFPADIAWLRRAIEKTGASLVIIDPLAAHLGSEVNSWKDQDVRAALAPLARLAAEMGVAIIVIRHLTKASVTEAIKAGGGSIGIIGAARAALLVAADPDDEDRCVLAVVKSNLAKKAGSLVFRLVDTGNGYARIQWDGASTRSADELVMPPGIERRRDGDARNDAGEMLLHELLGGGARWRPEVIAEAQRRGFSERTIERAANRLLVVRETHGFGALKRTAWSLPGAIPGTDPVIGGDGGNDGLGGIESISAIPANPVTPSDGIRDGRFAEPNVGEAL